MADRWPRQRIWPHPAPISLDATTSLFLIASCSAVNTKRIYRQIPGSSSDIWTRTQRISLREMTQSSHPTPFCKDCSKDMWPNGITPFAGGYDMWSYICKGCGRHFRMVEPRTAYSASVSERRRLARLAVSRFAIFEASEDIAPCRVRDLSAAGAGINLTKRAKIPERFRIVIDGSRLLCRLVWREKTFIGVEFRQEKAISPR